MLPCVFAVDVSALLGIDFVAASGVSLEEMLVAVGLSTTTCKGSDPLVTHTDVRLERIG